MSSEKTLNSYVGVTGFIATSCSFLQEEYGDMNETSFTVATTTEQDMALDTAAIRERLQSLEDGVILEIPIGGEDSGKE